MKKILYILLLITTGATAQVKVGADGAIHPTGNYPATSLREAKAYALTVESITDRDNIPANYRDTGMIILVREGGIFYSLVGGITNSDWLAVGGGGTVVTDGLIQPGYVTWSGTGLTFNVTSAIYGIGGTIYTSPAGSITLDPSDPSLPRYDVIAVDRNSTIVKITGTPAANPIVPQVDPGSQVFLTSIYLAAGAVTPTQIRQTIIYDENIEPYTHIVTSGLTVNFDNATNVFHGLKSMDIGSAIATKNIDFTRGAGLDTASNYSMINLYVKLKDTFATNGNLRITFLNGNTAVSNNIVIGATNGFNKKNKTTYQNIIVPISAFTFSSTIFNKIRLTLTGTTNGLYADYFQLQAGIIPAPNPPDGRGVVSFAKNGTRDSIILTLVDGTRYAVKDSIGTGGSGGSQNLQSVTDIGATTTNPLLITSPTLGPVVTLTNSGDIGGVQVTNPSTGTQVNISGDGSIQQTNTNGFPSAIRNSNITGTQNYELPNVSGTLAESVTVNGTTTHADAVGNINLGTIGGGGSDSSGMDTAYQRGDSLYGVKNGVEFFVGSTAGEATGVPGTKDTLWYNVKWFGAVGDGVTDDRAAIQTANDYVSAVHGGYIWFPAGVYIVSSGVYRASYVNWEGVKDSSILKNINPTLTGFGSQAVMWMGNYNPSAYDTTVARFFRGHMGTYGNKMQIVDSISKFHVGDVVVIEGMTGWMNTEWKPYVTRYNEIDSIIPGTDSVVFHYQMDTILTNARINISGHFITPSDGIDANGHVKYLVRNVTTRNMVFESEGQWVLGMSSLGCSWENIRIRAAELFSGNGMAWMTARNIYGQWWQQVSEFAIGCHNTLITGVNAHYINKPGSIKPYIKFGENVHAVVLKDVFIDAGNFNGNGVWFGASTECILDGIHATSQQIRQTSVQFSDNDLGAAPSSFTNNNTVRHGYFRNTGILSNYVLMNKSVSAGQLRNNVVNDVVFVGPVADNTALTIDGYRPELKDLYTTEGEITGGDSLYKGIITGGTLANIYDLHGNTSQIFFRSVFDTSGKNRSHFTNLTMKYVPDDITLDGQFWYDQGADELNFRHNGTTTDLLAGGSSTPIQTLTNGFGILGSPFNGIAPQTWQIDTSVLNTQIFSDSSNTQFFVDTISVSPPAGAISGAKVLVAHLSATGAFATHEDQIATLTGAVWSFQIADTSDNLIVSNQYQPTAFYQFNGAIWNLQRRAASIGGDRIGANYDLGALDAQSFRFLTQGNIRERIASNGDHFFNGLIGTKSNNFLKVDSATGKLLTDSFTIQKVKSPIGLSGDTIYHAASGVTAGSYTSANITVDSMGHVTLAANGSGGGATSDTTKQYRTNLYGIIKNQASFDTSLWSTQGGSPPTITSGSLDFSSGAGANTFTKSFNYNYTTGLARWKIFDTVIITEKSATSYGNGIGIRSASSGLKIDNAAWFDASTGANSGKISVYGFLLTTSAMGSVTSTAALTFSVNDTIIITCERNLDTLIGTAFNQTTKSAPVSISYACGSNNRGKFAIFNLGGTFTVAGVAIQSAETVKADLMYVGDSKWRTSSTNNYATRAYALLSADYPSYVVDAGSSDYSADVVAKLPEIIALQPRQVVMLINYNDLANSIATATWQGNDTAINGQLTRAGIRVYWANTYSSTGSGVSTTRIDSFYSAVFPNTYIRQTYVSTRNYPGTVLADGVHLTDFGQRILATAIINSNPFTDGNSVNPFTTMSISNPVTQPSNQIVYGTGTGISSGTAFTRDTSNNITINGVPVSALTVYKSSTKGTIAKTSGLAALTGTGTNFLSDLKPGDNIYTSDGEFKVILAITGNTSATITTTWASTCTTCTFIDSSVTISSPIFQASNNGNIKKTGENLIVSSSLGIGVGYQVMNTKGIGFHNSAFGVGALNNSAANYNTGIGYNAGGNITGIQNTILGAHAFETGTTGDENVVIGYNAMNGGSGGGNVIVGSRAALASIGGGNTGIGQRAFNAITTGSNNIAIGNLSDFSNKTGSTRTIIGYRAMMTWNASNVSNYDNTIYMTNKNGVDSTVSTTSKVGIDTDVPNSTFHINGSFAKSYVAKTGTYTATATDYLIDCTSGTFTVTLPTAVSITGREYKIVNSGSGTITIGTTSSQTFVNIVSTPTTLTMGAVAAAAIVEYTVTSNGANWIVTGKVKNE